MSRLNLSKNLKMLPIYIFVHICDILLFFVNKKLKLLGNVDDETRNVIVRHNYHSIILLEINE